jgi:hypothetical protein
VSAQVTTNDGKTGFNTLAVVLGGAAALIFLWALALFLEGGFLAAHSKEFAAKVYAAPASEEKLAALAEQQTLLDEPVRWLNEEEGTVVMPIEDAMQQFVKKVGQSQ